MRLAALAIAGVMILTTEKLDVVVVLVEVEIEVAAALRAFPVSYTHLSGRGRGSAAFCPRENPRERNLPHTEGLRDVYKRQVMARLERSVTVRLFLSRLLSSAWFCAP